jgi:hypothetical protein
MTGHEYDIISGKLGHLEGLLEGLATNQNAMRNEMQENREERQAQLAALPCIMHTVQIKGLEVRASLWGAFFGVITAGVTAWWAHWRNKQ